MAENTVPTQCKHIVNPATDRCVLCGKNRFNREREDAIRTMPGCGDPVAEQTVKQWMRDAAEEIASELGKHDVDDITCIVANIAERVIAAHAPQDSAAAEVPEGITPLPWKIGLCKRNSALSIWASTVAEGETGNPVCLISPEESRNSRDEANASYIVQACNAYPQLLAALRESERALERAERKLRAYVGVCAGDKELVDTVLPMASAALSTLRPLLPPLPTIKEMSGSIDYGGCMAVNGDNEIVITPSASKEARRG